MKTIPAALAAHLALDTTTLAFLLQITRSDAQVFAFTSALDDVTIAGVTYRSAPGLSVSNIVMAAGIGVDNLELTTLDDGTTFTRQDVLSGIWRNASFQISRYNWASPTDGLEPIMYGTIGNVQLRLGQIVAELRGLQQYLQQPIGNLTSKTCRARLGDSLCTVNLAAYTFTAAVTSVTSSQIFTASALAQAADYFGSGVLTWTGGGNALLSAQVKTHAAGGVLTLSLPMLVPVVVGDTFSIVAGCRKRHDRTAAKPAGVSDCLDKFNNVPNFQGEPHLPGIDAITSAPV